MSERNRTHRRYTIVELLLSGLPSVETDLPSSILTRRERHQLNLSGSLNAPWVNAVDAVFRRKYHKQLEYLYPHDILADADAADSLADGTSVLQGCVAGVTPAETAMSARPRVGAGAGEGAPRTSVSDTSCRMSLKLNKTAHGWDSPWYVAALGRCDRDHLNQNIKRGLLKFVSGSAYTSDRFIVQAAVTSIGRLYRGTRNAKVSRRLYECWSYNEISSIRDHCVIALKAIGNAYFVDFVSQIRDMATLQDTQVAENFFQTRYLASTDILHTRDLTSLAKYLRSDAQGGRFMACISACCIASSFYVEVGDAGVHTIVSPAKVPAAGHGRATLTQRPFDARETNELIALMCKVALDTNEVHMIKTAALEFVSRIAKLYVKLDLFATEYTSVQNEVWRAMYTIIRTDSFKSVRTAATKVAHASARAPCVFPQRGAWGNISRCRVLHRTHTSPTWAGARGRARGKARQSKKPPLTLNGVCCARLLCKVLSDSHYPYCTIVACFGAHATGTFKARGIDCASVKAVLDDNLDASFQAKARAVSGAWSDCSAGIDALFAAQQGKRNPAAMTACFGGRASCFVELRRTLRPRVGPGYVR